MQDRNVANLLILGKPGSSKTTFLSQLLSIARKKTSKVSFYRNPENIEPLKLAIDRLRNGKEASGTTADVNTIITLPINLDGQLIELTCPDYGGEQIRNIILLKEVSPEWVSRINSSDNWLLFIRINSIDKNFDLTTKNGNEADSKKQKVATDYKLSEEVSFIQLLQILLFAKGLGLLEKKYLPNLTIALTCYDEAKVDGQTPEQILKEQLPLLEQFIFSQWEKSAIKIIGVSAQGFNLKISANQQKYIEEGNDKFPFVVPNGSTEKIFDLSYVLQESIR